MLLAIGFLTVLTGAFAMDFVSHGDNDEGDDEDFDQLPEAEPNAGEDLLSYLDLEADVQLETEGFQVYEDTETSDDVFSQSANDDFLAQATGVKAQVEGTDGNDVLSGVNARIDVATGIVALSGNSADFLIGGEGDDEIGVGFADFASGGGGTDTFIVDGDASESEAELDVPTVLDFRVGEDLVIISIPTSEQDLLEADNYSSTHDEKVTFETSDGFTTISIDDVLVCRLVGEHLISENDVKIERDYHGSISTDFDLLYGYAN